MFKKNSMEFFIRLDYYLYYSYSGYTTISSWSHVLPECSIITWSCHVIWLPKLPCYLYLNPFVQLSAQICGILFPFWGSHNTVIPLSNSAFTATPSWPSSFSNLTFIHTFLSSCSICHISLALSVLLWQFNLFPSFSRHNTLYKLLEVSWELTVLHFLLPTLVAFLLSSSLFPFFVNNFWLYGPIFYI